jgi:hypothetical protein
MSQPREPIPEVDQELVPQHRIAANRRTDYSQARAAWTNAVHW